MHVISLCKAQFIHVIVMRDVSHNVDLHTTQSWPLPRIPYSIRFRKFRLQFVLDLKEILWELMLQTVRGTLEPGALFKTYWTESKNWIKEICC